MSPRLPRRFLLGYWIFVVYGSFIPFVFNLDPNFVHWRLDIFLFRSLSRGVTRWSWSDIIVNVLLYFPLGLLGLARLGRARWFAQSFVMPLIVGAIGLCAGLAVELGQTLSPYRSPSMLDAFCNGFGALIGAAAASFLLCSRGRSFGSRVGRLVRAHPAECAAGVLLVVALAGSYYPFIPAPDALYLRFNSTRAFGADLWPATPRAWIDIVINKGVIFAAFGFARYRTPRRSRLSPALSVWLEATLTAATIEAGKLLFIGPAFQAVNIFASSVGALCGVMLIPALSSKKALRSRRQAALLAVLLALLCYFELRPFDWIYFFELPAKIKQIEWLPFFSYYGSTPQAAFFDLAKKLILTLPLGYLIVAASPNRAERRRARYAGILGALVGMFLETCQLLTRSRVTSITDVLIFTFGSWVGALAFNWFHASTATTSDLGNPRAAPIESPLTQGDQRPTSAAGTKSRP